MTTALVVEDHTSFRQSLAMLLRSELDFELVEEAATVHEARAKLAGVDVAIIDLNLPDGCGVDLVRELRAVNSAAGVLVLTGVSDRYEHGRAVEAGAAGVLHKTASLEEVIAATRRVSSGEILFSPREILDLMQVVMRRREREQQARAVLESLTPREREILAALAYGLSDKAIAQRLNIALETVRTHMVKILRKLGVDSRLAALVYALRHGVVELPSASSSFE